MDGLRVAFGGRVGLVLPRMLGRRTFITEVFMHRLVLVFAVVSLSLPAFARSSDDRASVGSDITIAEGQTVGDVACAFCSVRVHGEVKGDVAVVFGDITVDAGKSVGGD